MPDTRRWSANTLKLIAIVAMAFDHLLWVLFPGYKNGVIVFLLHSAGRITAPIMCFFVAEGYFHTRSRPRYALRLLLFALISHFAYTFAFGIPFLPFQTGIFNQTSVMWPLFLGLLALWISESQHPRLTTGIKLAALLALCALALPADWSCIAVLLIVFFGANRNRPARQAWYLLLFTALYAAVYCLWIDLAYGLLQFCTMLAVPLFRQYNGTRGRWRGMKWFFYGFYPAHLLLCGLLRLALYGNVGVLIGGS